MALLSALAALPALALLTLLALLPLALLSEGIVEKLLLPPDDLAELVHHLAHALALPLVGHAARLQAVEEVAQLAQHLLRRVLVAGPRHVLQVLEHLVEIAARHHLTVAIHPLHRRLVLRLLLQLVEELRERLPQLLHEPLDLLVRGAVLERLRQTLLRLAQRTFRVGEIAVLDAQGDIPQLCHHAAVAGPAVVTHEPPVGRADAEVDLQIVDEAFGFEGQRLQRLRDIETVARIFHEMPALLDDGARQRLAELPLGQHHFERLAAPRLAREILGDEGKFHGHAGPEMVAEFLEALPLRALRIGLRQPQRDRGGALVGLARPAIGFVARPGRRRRIRFRTDPLDAGFRRHHAVVVFDLVEELQPTAQRTLGLFRQRDGRRVVGRHLDRPGADTRAVRVDGEDA